MSQLNKDLKDRNDELERKLQILSELSESQKFSNCQNGPMKDLKGEKEKQSCPPQVLMPLNPYPYIYVICENYAIFSTAWLGGFLVKKLAGPQFPAASPVCRIVD